MMQRITQRPASLHRARPWPRLPPILCLLFLYHKACILHQEAAFFKRANSK